jgi:hypothetical protein
MMKSVEASMNVTSAITFDTAEREYNEAWNAPSNTRFELAPVDVNTVLKKRYRVSPEKTLTRTMIWDMETKKAWDPLSYIPYVVSQARSWGRTTLRDGTRFSRSSLQRGWITSEEGRVLEDVFVSDAKQTIWDGLAWLTKTVTRSWRVRTSHSFTSDMPWAGRSRCL